MSSLPPGLFAADNMTPRVRVAVGNNAGDGLEVSLSLGTSNSPSLLTCSAQCIDA